MQCNQAVVDQCHTVQYGSCAQAEEASSRVVTSQCLSGLLFLKKFGRFVGDGVDVITKIGGRAEAFRTNRTEECRRLKQHCMVVVEDAAGRRHWEKHGSIGSERIPGTSLGVGK